LTDSDLLLPSADRTIGMNNVILRATGKPAAFITQAVTGGFGNEAGTYYHGDAVRMVHDIGNNGEPGRLPTILNEALAAIDPRRNSHIADPFDHANPVPKAIVLLSQYAPNGLLANALAYADTQGAYVSAPLQPKGDHRSDSFPYNLNNAGFALRAIGRHAERRAVPSHIKALLVRYHDATAKIIFGTDNFVTNLQKAVRNEEIATIISIDLKNDAGAAYLDHLAGTLHAIGEISTRTLAELAHAVIVAHRTRLLDFWQA
jgi:hypothetical protein